MMLTGGTSPAAGLPRTLGKRRERSDAPARLIAFYLPQFHPIPENDAWWGNGFTEWTNTAKAKPLFHGHYQPHVPADLGFYDLRVAETRQAQADLAAAYGIAGFCYYHYWFAGKRLLERPFTEVLGSGSPDFPFCLCWANQTWTGIWHGEPDRILIEQTYPGEADHRAHFEALLPAFSDDRYMRVAGKPIFVIFRPTELPDSRRTLDFWREMAAAAGLRGLHLVGVASRNWNPIEHGFDAVTTQVLPTRRPWVSKRRPIEWFRRMYQHWSGLPTIYAYQEAMADLMPRMVESYVSYPTVIHAWDNSPRSGREALVLRDSSPELFRPILRRALDQCSDKPVEARIVFLKSWNEWAEGNHLEPDLKFGHGFLKVIAEELRDFSATPSDLLQTASSERPEDSRSVRSEEPNVAANSALARR